MNRGADPSIVVLHRHWEVPEETMGVSANACGVRIFSVAGVRIKAKSELRQRGSRRQRNKADFTLKPPSSENQRSPPLQLPSHQGAARHPPIRAELANSIRADVRASSLFPFRKDDRRCSSNPKSTRYSWNSHPDSSTRTSDASARRSFGRGTKTTPKEVTMTTPSLIVHDTSDLFSGMAV